ncbi:hypothetical protein PRIPAC_90285 [Pristionchus pacificus]|uniref:Uncharacterized protein n=1 Tax=Pristionchus pacificus TaxID=54126 RepID=A0A2A6B5V4_PRIPA|nr:hypothetical protein PRIPAC_90285 [Pristionchus pacificus]|eukprot:PDM61260.1 hypothetical protein PRIPAC_50702 [Pristionchus pacificus]
MLRNIFRLIFLISEWAPASRASTICHQCNGWSGNGFSRSSTEENSCQNYNNQCLTEFFCVRKEDPIIPSAGYKTYKSDCWMQPSVQISPTDAVQIESGRCYNVTDASVPPKQWKYCFCANKDYCNSGQKSPFSFLLPIFILVMLVNQ